MKAPIARATRWDPNSQIKNSERVVSYCPEKGDRKKHEPNARTLVRCANRAGLVGEPLESILERLAGSLDAVRARREAHRAEMEGSKHEIDLEIKRLDVGARTLRNLEASWPKTAWRDFRVGINARS